MYQLVQFRQTDKPTKHCNFYLQDTVKTHVLTTVRFNQGPIVVPENVTNHGLKYVYQTQHCIIKDANEVIIMY